MTVHAPTVTLPVLGGGDVVVGKGPALLVFFKRDCGACQIAIPRLPRVADAVPELTVLGISQDDERTTSGFTGKQAVGLRVAVDAPGYEASEAYDVETVPHFVVVDADGEVVASDFGWDRTRFNELASQAAALVGADVADVVPEGDGPPFRPG